MPVHWHVSYGWYQRVKQPQHGCCGPQSLKHLLSATWTKSFPNLDLLPLPVHHSSPNLPHLIFPSKIQISSTLFIIDLNHHSVLSVGLRENRFDVYAPPQKYQSLSALIHKPCSSASVVSHSVTLHSLSAGTYIPTRAFCCGGGGCSFFVEPQIWNPFSSELPLVCQWKASMWDLEGKWKAVAFWW